MCARFCGIVKSLVWIKVGKRERTLLFAKAKSSKNFFGASHYFLIRFCVTESLRVDFVGLWNRGEL